MTVTVSGGRIRVELDASSGAITRVRDTYRDLELCAGPGGVAARIELTDLGWIHVKGTAAVHAVDGGRRLEWQSVHGVGLVAEVLARGDDVVFRVGATNEGSARIERIEYPILAGVGRLGGPGQDELTHSHASGFLFHDPVDLFGPDPDNHRRVGQSPYPEGFAGATMQFLAYQARGVGGFLFGTEDAGRSLKWLDVSGDGERLRLSVTHKSPTLKAGSGFWPGYATVVAPVDGGDWTDAAERYRAWALRQPWAQVGPRAEWLRRDIGICTFGVSSRHDRSAWLHEIGRMAGAPVFHVLGPDWAAGGQDYRQHIPRGRREWLPGVFHPANLAAIREHDGRWAPFEFDLFSALDPDSDEPVLDSRMLQHRAQSDAVDSGIMRFPFMCPGSDYWRSFHAERDASLAAEHGADAVYYDISLHNLLFQCLAEGHGHDPCTGEPIAAMFETMYRETSAAMSRAAGRYVPMGTEVMTETSLSLFDFSQHRADAGPYAPFEAHVFRDWVLDGSAERIPLLSYVFGERTPLRMDGWAKLSPATGDLWYWVAARVLLEGGLLEVNGEFSLLEDVGDWSESPGEHYSRIDTSHHGIDPAKATFLRQVAQTRVGRANPWLSGGHMLPAPTVEAPAVELAWTAYNAAPDHGLRGTSGSMTVPSVLAQAWRRDGADAWLVANVSPQSQTVRVDGREVHLDARQIRFIQP